MIIAPTSIHAAASTALTGRHALVRAVVLGCAIACAGLPALAAQDRDGRDGRRAQQQAQPVPHEQPRAERMAPPQQQRQMEPQRAEPRQYQYDSRAFDARAEEQRRQAQQQDPGARRGGRLTPDERRELRRQINEAGMDLYPNTPRR